LAHFSQQLPSSDDGSSITNATQVAQQITQEKSSTGQNISESVVTKAVQIATGANSSKVKQLIGHAAQILANRAGVPVDKVEAVIIQIALQISQEQGKAITAQSVSQIVNQIAQNPNGVIAQAILKIVKQYTDDNGKTGKMVNIIDDMIKSGGGNSKTILKMISDRGKEGGRDGPLTPGDDDDDGSKARANGDDDDGSKARANGDDDDDDGSKARANGDDDDDGSKARANGDDDDGSKARANGDDDDGRDEGTTFSFDQNQKNECSSFVGCSNTATLIFTVGD
jgi:hypothetical protein